MFFLKIKINLRAKLKIFCIVLLVLNRQGLIEQSPTFFFQKKFLNAQRKLSLLKEK